MTCPGQSGRELAGEAKQLHVLMNNCYADYGVRNAGQFARLLSRRAGGPS